MGVGGQIAWFGGAASVSEDAIVTDWVSRTATAGGSVATATRNAMDVYIKGLKTDLIWTKMSGGVILPFASDDFAGVFEPLIIPSGKTLTNNNFVSGNYSLTTGLDPGAANNTKQITTDVIPSDVFTSSSIQVSFYELINRGGASGLLASNDSASAKIEFLTFNTGVYFWDCINGASGRLSIASTAVGLLTGLRNSSGNAYLINGTSVASSAGVGGTLPVDPISLFRRKSTNTFGKNPISYIYFGSSLTVTEEALHYNRVQVLQTALGRQV